MDQWRVLYEETLFSRARQLRPSGRSIPIVSSAGPDPGIKLDLAWSPCGGLPGESWLPRLKGLAGAGRERLMPAGAALPNGAVLPASSRWLPVGAVRA